MARRAGAPDRLRAGRVVSMTYEVTIGQREAQQAAVMTADLGRDEVPGFLARAYGQLFADLGSRGGSPAGPPFARYRIDGDTFHVTAGVPVAAVPAGIQSAELPGGTVATTVHVGSYEGLPEAFHAVIEWIGANGYRISSEPWESYLDDPSVPAPRTEVCFPVSQA